MKSEFDPLDFIARQRDGQPQSKEGIDLFIRAIVDGEIPDYQISAWLMAEVLKPFGFEETVELTKAIANSGERLNLEGIPKPWVDKHSTGGVGDKTSLVVAPLLASCGIAVVKMSGRGLGITGGTLDKLASVPGFRLDLTPKEMVDQAKKIGLCLSGQTGNLAPADKILYALRDATATVSSLPLIVSSILSKKIAGGAEYIVIDVKCGSGAFITSVDQAKALKEELIEVGKRCGLTMSAHITDMDQPLGESAGNALEVREAIRVLSGDQLSRPEERFKELCVSLTAMALLACGKSVSLQAGLDLASGCLESGAARRKAEQWFLAQGASALEVPIEKLKELTLLAQRSGHVAKINARTVGKTVVELGGGRERKDDEIDYQVGVKTHALVGDSVKVGDPLFTILARTEADLDKVEAGLASAVSIVDSEVAATPLFLD